MEPLIDELLAARISCAPHVLTALAQKLSGDTDSIRQVAGALTPAERHGLRPLPSPLPLVPAITDAFGSRVLSAADRSLLLAIALGRDDRLVPVLHVDGRDAVDIASGPLGADLRIRAGRICLIDQRWATWIEHTSPPGEQVAMHERLSVVFECLGDAASRDWHRARASLQGSPASARRIIRLACELSEAGHSARALDIAREASAHADGADRDRADLVAGIAAVGAGFAVEASERLSALFPKGMEGVRLQGLAGLLVAQAHLQGGVPDVQPRAFRPTSDATDAWLSWTRAAAFAAVLCAERGDRRRMRVWLDAVREGSARLKRECELRDPVVALSWLLAGDPDVDGVSGAGPLSGRMLRSLRAAVDGDIDHALQLLGAGDTGVEDESDPLLAGFERSPVVRAYRSVLEALLLFWRGDVTIARDRLNAAALVLPIAIPFAGLGVVLARRLDVAVLGELGSLARALTASLPPTARIDLLVDRSIQSYLAGAVEDAEAARLLWLERGAPQSCLAVPGLDAPESSMTGVPMRRVIRPPDLDLTEQLQRRAAAMTPGDWRRQRQEIHRSAREIRSPFSRGRVELALATLCIDHGDIAAADDHLRTALRLFEISGADAWSRAVQRRRDRLSSVPEPPGYRSETLATCRRAWSTRLTAREVEVAMLAAGGASNREIADALRVSVRTVEVHLGRIFTKLEVRTRVELTVLAHRTDQHA